MNTAQVTTCLPGIYVKSKSQLHQLHSKPCVLRMSPDPCSSISLSLRATPSFGLKCWSISKSREPLHICFAGGKGMMEKNDEVMHLLLSYNLICYYVINVCSKHAYNFKK